MACDTATLLAEACEDGLTGLSERELNIAIAAAMLPGAGYPTADEVMLESACYAGYTDRQLDEMIAAQFCLLFG